MDEGKSKIKHPSVPPGYVSFNQLRERWLQKQQEKKLEGELKQSIEIENQKLVENGIIEKQGGVIEEEEESAKEKDVEQNGEEKKKKKKKKKKNWSKKKQSLVDVEKENPRTENNCNVHEFEGKKESEGVEIVSKIESKLGNEGNVSMVDDFPRNGVRKEDSNVKMVKGGGRRNGNDRGAGRNLQEYRVKLKVNEMEMPLGKVGGEKGNRNKGREMRNGDNSRVNNRLKENKAELDVLKGNELEVKSGKVPEDEILHVGSKIVGTTGINRNGPHGKGERDQGEDLNNKTRDEDSVVGKAKACENGEAKNGFMRYGNRKGNTGRKFGEHSAFGDLSAGNERARVEMNIGNNRRYASSGRSDGWKLRQRDSSMVWLKKDEKLGVNNAAEVGSTGISPDRSN